MNSREEIRAMLNIQNQIYWIKYGEDMYCKVAGGHVHKDWDCEECQQCDNCRRNEQ
jgi:hypothetical protein